MPQVTARGLPRTSTVSKERQGRPDHEGTCPIAAGWDRVGLGAGPQRGDIAVMFAATDGYVREVIDAFNEQGFAALDPKWSGGHSGR